jgi:hypothetical protein
MAESNENIAKNCENSKENEVKVKENGKASSLSNGKHDGRVVKAARSEEASKSIISRKNSPTPSHKSLQKSDNSNHVVPKSGGKPKSESKNSNETPLKDRKKGDGHGK